MSGHVQPQPLAGMDRRFASHRQPAAGGCRYRRTVINPARPKAPTEDMIRRIDEEAAISLQKIKRAVEARRGGAWG